MTKYLKIRDWIPIDKIEWIYLLHNINAIYLMLDKNQNKINIVWLHKYIYPNQNTPLYRYTYNGKYREKYFDEEIIWTVLSKYFDEISFLEKNLDKIDWYALSQNPNAIHLVEQHLDKVNWYALSSNPRAIHMLEQNLDKIYWDELSSNPNAIHILEQNLDKINWEELSRNPNAIHLLEQNLDKINWEELSRNPSIFTYDYDEIKLHMKNTIAEDLMKNRFNIKYQHKWKNDWGFDDCLDENDLDD
jgi:hypothetical protein